MSKTISVSRAARLVGVKRGALQQQKQSGTLKTFEGQIDLVDLLRAYPDAEIEDSSMLERVEQIIEQAPYLSQEARVLPGDNAALSARFRSLSQELYREKRARQRLAALLDDLEGRLGETSTPGEHKKLLQWLQQARVDLKKPGDAADEPLANEAFLRVMTAQATIVSSGHEFFVEGVESILEAGLRGGFALNYGCSNGNCGLCKIRVLSGETQRIRHHDYSLTEAEKGLGYILSCCYTAVSDIALEADEANSFADIPQQNIPIRIKKIDRPNEEILIVSARTPRTNRLRFLAGQRAQLSVDHVGESTYPIASCPCDDMNLQFHIPLNPQDSIANFLDQTAKINDLVTLDGPSGSFVLDENSSRSLIFIAQDSGYATIKGLIEHAMALDTAEHIYLFWLAADSDSLYSNNLCRAWNDALDNFYYVPLHGDEQEKLEQHILSQLGDSSPEEFDYYLCADNALGNRIGQFIDSNKVPANQFHFDEK